VTSVLIIGGAGMIGAKLARRLATDGKLGGKPVTSLTLADIVAPPLVAAPFRVDARPVDLAAEGAAAALVASRPDVIFHLAAVLSAESETDLDKGYRVNIDGTRALFDAIRHIGDGYRPRLVFSSSIAVYGAPFPPSIGDEFFETPLTSYGTAKAISELFLADYSRRGFLDGVGIRLPTICVRPGKPNKAASSFFSGIIREPLAGQEAVLPVAETVRHWHASPKAAVGFLMHAGAMDTASLGDRRNLNMPGVSETVGGQIAALSKVAGDSVAARIRREPDPFIQKIVSGWAENFDARRALSLGFTADRDFEEIIRIHIADELGGTWVK
jgi:nucleoside-diphosphate-sugar epimerase